uniref:Uncharacterized protein n=1 Tax=Phlebotomus papatasi TaxID=29031 RepID=A0A1B0D114_PHLPP
MRLRSFYLAAVYFISLAIQRYAESTELPASIENDESLEVVNHKTHNVVDTTRDRLKKIFIPMLLILKLFKLKLLLLLPFIFGLASFKKILGFLIIIVPAILGFLKLQSLQQMSHMDYQSGGLHMQYSPQGVGGLSYYPHHHPNFHRKSDNFRPDDYQPRRPYRPDFNSSSSDFRYPDSYLAVVGNRVPSARSRLTH